MSNTATQTVQQIANETPYLFINDAENNKILVCKKEWFSEMPITETYSNYGQLVLNDYEMYCNNNAEIKIQCEALGENEHCEECLMTVPNVTAYNYWDGSNHKSLIIESADFDTNIDVVENDEEIALYHGLVKKAQGEEFRQMGTGYNGCKIEGYEVVQSQWQGDFELYFISEIDEWAKNFPQD